MRKHIVWVQAYHKQPNLCKHNLWTQGEVRYGITSLPASVASDERLMSLARGAWGIENGLHYRRDVTLEADACQVRRGQVPHVLAALNNTVIGLMLQRGERNLAAEY